MEIQEKNGFSIVGFIAQVLVIVLFVFVLMWLFPTKSYIESHSINSNTGTSSLNELLVNQNLLSMKDAAREYFTVKRMPSTNGNEKILSLDDMIKSSMVVEYVDAYGKKCDRDKSYVKVTKVDDEYEMEVSLTCDKVTKKIITTIGCYDFCKSGLCEKETKSVTLYQYSKKVKGTSKWTDWSEWSKTKETASKTKKVETKTVKEASGTTTKTVNATATAKYTCSEGKLNGTKCVVATTGTKTVDATATTTYSCKEGKLSGNKCVITESIKATPHVKVSFNCVEGVCKSESKVDYYYCKDSSYKVVGKNCQKSKTVNATATTKYTCSEGTLNGNKCDVATTGTKTVDATATTTYSCKEGTLSGNKCLISEGKYINVTYYRYKTYVTTKDSIVYKWSTSSKDSKLIKAGYKYTGVTKTKTSK